MGTGSYQCILCHRWHEVLDPLYDKFQLWKPGQLDLDDMDTVIHETHKQTRDIFNQFTQKREWLVRLIQFDEAWFNQWVKENPPPPGYELIPPNLITP